MLQWNADRIAAIVDAHASEGQTLEFKAELPASSDRGRAEFLKDVSALANAAGGAMLYGVSEAGGVAEAVTGLRFPDADAEIRRLSQILESGVEPRVSGVRFATISTADGDVLAIDVPQSFDAPHRYLFNGPSKFVQRVGTHVSELTYDQLRSAFDRSSQRISSIRDEWAKDFALSHVWKPLEAGPVCVLRVSSLLSADARQVIDPQIAYNEWDQLIQSDWGGGSPAFNYQGLVAAPGRSDALRAYTQVHRIGAITSYRSVGTHYEGENLFIPGRSEKFIMEALPKSLDFLISRGIAGSAVIHIGLTRLSGYKLAFNDGGFNQWVPSDVDRLQLPEVLIDDLSESLELDTLLRPGFDLVWQAYGQPNCRNYGPDGVWGGRN